VGGDKKRFPCRWLYIAAFDRNLKNQTPGGHVIVFLLSHANFFAFERAFASVRPGSNSKIRSKLRHLFAEADLPLALSSPVFRQLLWRFLRGNFSFTKHPADRFACGVGSQERAEWRQNLYDFFHPYLLCQ
jgi:hypothetical protein